jgi:hypothetical protein
MQRIFDAGCSPQEYAAKGKAIEPPRPRICFGCKIGKPHKHGFYWRFCLDGHFCLRIAIRRYRCPRCGITISFLPSFCIPKFQHSLEVLWKVLHLRLEKGHSLRWCLKKLLKRFPHLDWFPQRISFYAKRFLDNLPWLESLLRNIFPRLRLGSDKKKRAKKVLATVRLGFHEIQSPARLFHEQCHRSFLAPLR